VYRAPTAVTFQSAEQTGGTSGTTDSTGLALSFDVDPTTLAASDITVTGATKGALSGSGTTRTLAISDITVANGATVEVTIADPSGYAISGSPQAAVVYKDTTTAVTFQSAEQTGGTSGTTDSTGLALSFDVDPTTLAASDITVTGATKGTLSGSGTTRTLAISDITVANGETVSVAITSPSGFTISGSPQTAVVYRWAYVGKPYQGGVIAYIFQPDDPGYVSGQTHGLIAATADQDGGAGIAWDEGTSIVTGATGTALGTGQSNTTAIVANQGPGSYAAQLCNDYTNADNGTGVYSDWYLPSRNELSELYFNKGAIGGFVSESYWSSSEAGEIAAHSQSFHLGLQDVSSKSYWSFRVRAVRSF
jgi:hypothetical protein